MHHTFPYHSPLPFHSSLKPTRILTPGLHGTITLFDVLSPSRYLHNIQNLASHNSTIPSYHCPTGLQSTVSHSTLSNLPHLNFPPHSLQILISHTNTLSHLSPCLHTYPLLPCITNHHPSANLQNSHNTTQHSHEPPPLTRTLTPEFPLGAVVVSVALAACVLVPLALLPVPV